MKLLCVQYMNGVGNNAWDILYGFGTMYSTNTCTFQRRQVYSNRLKNGSFISRFGQFDLLKAIQKGASTFSMEYAFKKPCIRIWRWHHDLSWKSDNKITNHIECWNFNWNTCNSFQVAAFAFYRFAPFCPANVRIVFQCCKNACTNRHGFIWNHDKHIKVWMDAFGSGSLVPKGPKPENYADMILITDLPNWAFRLADMLDEYFKRYL